MRHNTNFIHTTKTQNSKVLVKMERRECGEDVRRKETYKGRKREESGSKINGQLMVCLFRPTLHPTMHVRVQ